MQEQLWRKEEDENKAIKIRDLIKNHCLGAFRITNLGAIIIIQTGRKSEADEEKTWSVKENATVTPRTIVETLPPILFPNSSSVPRHPSILRTSKLIDTNVNQHLNPSLCCLSSYFPLPLSSPRHVIQPTTSAFIFTRQLHQLSGNSDTTYWH